MEVVIVTAIVFALVILLMSIGVIVSGKRIKGSCGGLNAIESLRTSSGKCDFCGVSYEEVKVNGCPDKSEKK